MMSEKRDGNFPQRPRSRMGLTITKDFHLFPKRKINFPSLKAYCIISSYLKILVNSMFYLWKDAKHVIEKTSYHKTHCRKKHWPFSTMNISPLSGQHGKNYRYTNFNIIGCGQIYCRLNEM